MNSYGIVRAPLAYKLNRFIAHPPVVVNAMHDKTYAKAQTTFPTIIYNYFNL